MASGDLDVTTVTADVQWSGGEGDFTVAQAQAITAAIKGTADRLWMLLEQAHDRRAWAALGYSTWEKYVTSEFNISRSRSYQILDLGHVTRAIESALPVGVDAPVMLNERDARILKPHLDDVVQEIAERTDGVDDPQQVSQVITDVVAEVRDYHASSKATGVDASVPLAQMLGPRGDWDVPGAGDAAVEVDSDADVPSGHDSSAGSDGNLDSPWGVPEASGVYEQVQAAAIGADVFTAALEQLAAAPVDVDTLARVLPPAKREFVEAVLPAALERLNELNQLLSARD